MKETLQRTAVVALVVALAVSGAGLTATPVAADHDCSTVNKGVWYTFSGVSLLGEATGGSGAGCDMWHGEPAVQEVRDLEKNKTKIDLYAAAAGQQEQSNVSLTINANYLQDTESIAWQKAEAAIAEAYENGSTKSEAKVAAREAIKDYYSGRQANLLQNWNVQAVSIDYIHDRAEQEGFTSGSASTWVHVAENQNGNDRSFGGLTNVSRTLINGSTMNEVTYAAGYVPEDFHIDSGTQSPSGSTESYETVRVPAPDGSYERMDYVVFEQYKTRWNEISTKQQSLNSEVDAFVDATWQDYQDGNINSTDVISRTTLMFEYGTRTANGSGNYYDMVGAAAGMGLDTPNLNGTGVMTMTIPDAGNSYEGLVFARNAPNNTWVVGDTYDPANITGPVMFATTDGQLFEVDRPFTIDSATDTEGNERSEVQTTNYNYKTANTSDLQGKYDRLLEMTQELENRAEELESGGGGGGGLGDASPYNVVALLLAGGALIYALGSRNGNER